MDTQSTQASKNVSETKNLPYSYMRVQYLLSYIFSQPTKVIAAVAIAGLLISVGEMVTSAFTRRRVLRGQWHSPRRLEEFQSRPGCYVIAIYSDNKVMENVYVGQSVDVKRRMREHLTGHGNKRVYQDVLLKKQIRIFPVYCKEKQLNRLEKKLIRVFRARKSYNIQRGGAKRR